MAKSRTIVPILLAVCIALIGSFLSYTWIKNRMTPQKVVKVEADVLPISIAAIDLPWGTKLNKDKIKLAKFLKETVPAGNFTDPVQLEDRVVVSPIKKNEPILESRLAPNSVSTGGVSAIVKEGKRAIAIKGDKVIGLSGLIQPGNRVDVLVTLKDPSTKKDVTKIVLQGILVLATGTEVEKDDKGEVSPVDVYTLEVDPEEGEKLSLAATQGRLQFALRNVTDMKTVLTNGATISKTLSSYRGRYSDKKPSKKKHSTSTKRTVYEIRGTKTSSRKF
jgi:pilus assembly protein CpaB